MSNEAIFFFFLALNLTLLLLLFRFFGRLGLYVSIVLSIVLCNIQVLKQVDLFGLHATLGNVLYAGIFLATDLLNERYGQKEARKGVLIGFIASVAMMAYMSIALVYTPNEYDVMHEHMAAIFGLVPAITFASLAAYVISQLHDVTVYHWLRERTGGRMLWLRNNLSTITSQLLDTAVFTGLATLLGAFPVEAALEIFLVTWIIKVLIAVLDTPFIYMAVRFTPTER